MGIILGNSTHIENCLEIARRLPQYFTQGGLENLNRDIKTHRLFLVEESGEVRGFITLFSKYPYVAEISWLAVKLEHQRKGYGTAMVNFITLELKSKGVRFLEVKTLAPEVNYPPYEPTRRFYEKSGFVLIDIIDPYPGWEPGNPCAIYVKIL
jgi:GNAT superfamily N-acetyltransferase